MTLFPNATRVVHLKKEPYDIRIDRATEFGNPFVIGRDGTRAEVILKYAEWVKTQPNILARLSELRGNTLGCWCKPLACHGDVLAAMADSLNMDS